MDLKEYLRDVSSASPTPGGGSASAVAALLGVSLMEMAIALTKGKKNFLQYASEYERVNSIWQSCKDELEWGMAEDAKAFAKVMELYRYKPSEQEVECHKSALEEAFAYAGRVPLQMGQNIVKALRAANDVKSIINQWVISDLIGGIELAMGALRSILLNTAINIDSMKDGARKEELAYAVTQCLHEAEQYYQILREELYSKKTFQDLK